MQYRAMIIVKNLPVIGWLIRTAIWIKDGVEYLLDERKDRVRYGAPIRFWMVWRRLGRVLTVSIREGAEKERNRKGGKRWGWTRGVRWVDRGVRGPEDRREMWLHSGDKVDGRESLRDELSDKEEKRQEIVIVSNALNGNNINPAWSRQKEFMATYGRRGLVGKKVNVVVGRNYGKTAAAKRTKEIMELHGIEVKEVGENYGKRLG